MFKTKNQSREKSYGPMIVATVIMAAIVIGSLIWIFQGETFYDFLVRASVCAVSISIFLCMVLYIYATLLFEFFEEAAPLAAKIGEEMTDAQKRSMLRRTLRWFTRFRKW
jgi:ACR3 family arsenite efflux pump ArsB